MQNGLFFLFFLTRDYLRPFLVRNVLVFEPRALRVAEDGWLFSGWDGIYKNGGKSLQRWNHKKCGKKQEKLNNVLNLSKTKNHVFCEEMTKNRREKVESR